MVRGQWVNLARMPGSHPYSLSKDILGFLMTTESQDLGLTSHPKDGAFSSIVSPSLYWGIRTHTDHRWAPPTGLTNTSSSSNLVSPGGLPSRYWPDSTLLSFSGQPVLGCRVIWLPFISPQNQNSLIILPHVIPNLYNFLCSVEMQMVLGPIDFHSMDKNTMEDKRDPELFDHQHSWWYLLYSTEDRNVFSFGMTWGWVNHYSLDFWVIWSFLLPESKCAAWWCFAVRVDCLCRMNATLDIISLGNYRCSMSDPVRSDLVTTLMTFWHSCYCVCACGHINTHVKHTDSI